MEFQVLDQQYQEKGSQKNGGQVSTLNRKLKINQRFPYKEDKKKGRRKIYLLEEYSPKKKSPD